MKTQFFFSDLNDTQKQNLAESMLNDHPMRLNNQIVEYILEQDDYENAPFTREDIINWDWFGVVNINGYEYQLIENERDEKLEFYEYLRDKADSIIDKLENLQIECDSDEDYDSFQTKLNKFELTQEKYQNIVDELESMDFDEKREIYQWFSCSDWLVRELESWGECTLDNEFWGRTCCGQSVVLDHVIQKIAFDYACDYKKDYLTAEQLEGL